MQKSDGGRKNLIVFCVSMSALLQYKEKMIEKIGEVMEAAFESREEAAFIWKDDAMIDLNEKALGQTLYKKYQALREVAVAGHTMIYAENISDETLAAVCDGYYGAPSALGNKFQVLHKPMMICDFQ